MSQSKSVGRSWRWRVHELAEEKGVSCSTVQAFCRDPQHDTTTAMWERLAQALDVPLAEMLGRVPAKEEHSRELE